MQTWNRQLHDKASLFKPLLSIIALAILSIGTFFVVSDHYVNILSERVEKQYRQNLINIVSVARHAVEPVLKKVRSGAISRAEAIERIRPIIRAMTYKDQDGKNYVFMTSYDGTTLVKPYEPDQEGKNQLNLRDIKGVYILRELIKAAKTTPEGSFVRYRYPHFSRTTDSEEKLTYVVGLPEIGCYIGTGMYMERAIQEQKETLAKAKYAAILMLFALLIPISVSVFIILNRNKKLLAEVKTRMKVEEDLKKGEEKYRSIFEHAIEGMFQTSTDGCLISVNPALARSFGYESPQTMLDSGVKTGELYADPEERKQVLQMINEQGSVKNHLVRMKRRDGAIRWFSLSTRVVRNDGGKILYYEGTLEDITEQKETAEKFSKVFLTTPDCIAISRLADGRLMELNLGFEKITGWKRSEAVGRTSYDIDFWVENSARDLMEEDLKAGRDILNRKFLFRRKDGSVRNGVYSARSIQIAGEGCLIFVMQDITDRKRLERESRQLEQQLAQAQKLDAIGQLAGGIAHDFNNILMGIQGNAAMSMMEYSPGHPQYQRMSRIEEYVKRGANLTRQLLGFAREGKYEHRILSLNDLVQKSARFFIETHKEIEAIFQLMEDLHPIEADAGQLEQVFLNLFINAGHAMPKGGRLYIQTDNVTLQETDVAVFQVKPGDYVKISVSDTGTGMDEKTLERIFEPFFTTKAEQGGTGLGLASSYGIIRNHGGIIKAYSERGHGATFHIYLPSSKKKVEKEEDSLQDKGLLRGTGGVLLIDDEPVILELGSELLTILGYTAFQAENKEDALFIYRKYQERIELIILDMILRGTSGSDVLKALRTINPEVKVLLSSGYGLQGEVQEVMEMGCIGFIQKPYNFSEFSRIVHQALNPPE